MRTYGRVARSGTGVHVFGTGSSEASTYAPASDLCDLFHLHDLLPRSPLTLGWSLSVLGSRTTPSAITYAGTWLYLVATSGMGRAH